MSSNQLIQTLKGFRDLLPEEKRQRDYVARSISRTFERFGFAPIETPTLEYASLLLGKYGDEADQLVYQFEDNGERQVALRYDQTVPTARVLVEHQNELPRGFRRYQIQNVFRAEKPQAGRYREFTQCDCDIFGSTDAVADAEILAVYYNAFCDLGMDDIIIQLNDRQTLFSVLEPYTTDEVDVFSLIQTVDKLDKKSATDVRAELVEKGLDIAAAKSALAAIESAEPTEQLAAIMETAIALGVDEDSLVFTPTLARGLDYYTGLIFEGRIPGYDVGSVGGGGRYDNLIESLSGRKMPAVGFGIGFDRTVEAATAKGLLDDVGTGTQVLVTVFDKETATASFSLAQELRSADVLTEVYPGYDSLGKQFKLADQKNISYVAIIGPEELEANVVTLRDMRSGDQEKLSAKAVVDRLR